MSFQDVQDKLVGATSKLIQEYREKLAAGDPEAAGQQLGIASRYLQDTYSEAHVTRDESGAVKRIQDYGAQSPHLHAGADVHEASATATELATHRLMQLANGNVAGADLANALRNDFCPLAPGAVARGSARQFTPESRQYE